MNWGALSWFIPVAAGVAIVASCAKALHWLISRRKALLATVSCHPFRIHPAAATFFEEYKEKIRTQITKFFERYPSRPEEGRSYDDRYSHGQSLADEIKYALIDSLPHHVMGAKGCWFARIENRGEKKCVDVDLKLPHATFATIQHDRSGDPIYLGKINEIVAIGELRPKGCCEVTAWTDTPVTNWHLRGVQLTHESGSGRVRASWQTDRFGFVVGKLAKTFLGLVLIVIGFLALMFFLAWGAMISGWSGPKPPLQPPQPSTVSVTPPPTLSQNSTETSEQPNTATPNPAATANSIDKRLRSEKDSDVTQARYRLLFMLNPEQLEQYDQAQSSLKENDYTTARTKFEGLRRAISPNPKAVSESAQLLDLNIYLTLLLEGSDSRAQKMMENFQFTGDTPSLYYAQAAWEFKHNNSAKANDWVASARKIYSPELNRLFADSLYDRGWLTP